MTDTTTMDDHGHGGTPHETPWVVTGPLLALALPSLAIGYMTIEPMLFGDYFGSAIYVADRHPVMHELNQQFHGAVAMGLHAVTTLPFWLAAAGVGLSAFFYLKRPDIPAAIAQRFRFLHRMLLNKYWFDELYSWCLRQGRACARRRPVAARRSERDRRPDRQRLGASGRALLPR